MHRNDSSRFLLYIEPKKEEKLKKPIVDDLTLLITKAMSESIQGSANYSNINLPEEFYNDGFMGEHETDCGEESDNHDYLLKNDMITNSLSIFYVKWYRNSIHENDWKKLKQLGDFYNININLPETFSNSPESTKPKTHEEHMKGIIDMMVEELGKNIELDIINKIFEMGKYDNSSTL